MKILIVEDESELSKSIAAYLQKENYTCEVAVDFQTATEKTETFDYDCILLDISLPGGNGLQVLKELKANRKTDGVIIISAKHSIDDRITGLLLGADDYLPKPFHLSELSARVAAIIRRRKFDGNSSIILNEICIDPIAQIVTINKTLLELTRKEFDLLLYLATNKNRVVSKNAIASHLTKGDNDFFDNYDFIYAHIKNLKKKLQLANCNDYIKSIYGMGYKFQI